MSQTNGTQDASDNNSDGGLSVNEAQRRIEALLGDSEDTETSTAKPAKGKPAVTPPNDEDDADGYEPTADDVGEPVVEEDEPTTTDEEDEPTEEVDDAPAPDPTAKYTTKVDGEEVQVTLKEALAGYSREASFTKKSQALAEERRTMDANNKAKELEIQAKQEHYVAQLAALEKALEQPEPNWAQIQRDNPGEFATMHAAWRIHQDNLNAIKQEQAAEKSKLAQKYQGERQASIAAERAKLIAAIPQWGDTTEKGATFRKALLDFGVSQGYDMDELNSTADHRALKLLHKAFLYNQSLAEKAKGKRKVEELQVIKPGSAPSSGRKPQTVVQKATAKLKKTGNIRDAAAAIEAMLG